MVLLMLTVTKNDYNLEYVMGRERKKKSNKDK